MFISFLVSLVFLSFVTRYFPSLKVFSYSLEYSSIAFFYFLDHNILYTSDEVGNYFLLVEKSIIVESFVNYYPYPQNSGSSNFT